MTPGLVPAAIDYLNAGLTIFPLAGKAPNTAIPGTGWREIAGHVNENDVEFLEGVFMHPATTGIGIVIPQGMIVVDIDGEEGAAAFRALVEGDAFAIIDTAVASTGRGMHLWYVTINEVRSTKLGEKLDLKGVGGYVAAPPSKHPSGATYRWLSPLVRDGRLSAAVIPDGIMTLLKDREQLRAAEYPIEKRHWDYRLEGTKMVPFEIEASLAGLAHAVANAKDGERNNMLNWAAYTARKEGFTLEKVMADLGTAAADCGLSAHEIRQTIRSAFRG